jgi:adenylate cyclase
MEPENTNSQTFTSLEQKMIQLTAIVSRMQNYLVESRSAAIPTLIYDGVGQAANIVPQILKKITNLEEERQSLRALAQIGQIVNSSLDLSEVLQSVMDTIIRLTGAERGFLMLKDETETLKTQVARNWEQESLDNSELSVSRTIINRVVESGQAVLTTNAQDDPRFIGQDSVITYNLRSILCVPMCFKGSLIGVLYADNRIRSGLFTPKQLDLLSDFANQGAVAIENARLFDRVKHTLAEVTELKKLTDNIFASITSGVLTLDVENRVVMCNRAAEEIVGIESSELIGLSLPDTLPSYMKILSPYMDRVLKNNQRVVGMEANFSKENHKDIDLRFSLSPLKDIQEKTQGVAVVMEDLTEIKQLEARQRLFQRMVSPAVIEQLDPNSLELGGRKAEISIFFGDIRGFTSFGEMVPPEGLVSVLNRYLALAADALLNEEGTVDKFLGDAVMAWFNAPVPQPDHTLRAVRAAMAIHKQVDKLHKELHPEVRLKFGIGIHVGEAVLGLIGTEKRLDYTAIGDSVNTAKRIQENALGGQILISHPAYLQVKNKVIVQDAIPIQAKGKRDPIIVYQVIGLK